MPTKLKTRLLLDLLMTILILFALAFRMTRDVAHEWIGLVVIVLFILHNIINVQWYRNTLSGKKKYSFRWGMNTVINTMLIVIMAVMAITGLMQSKVVLAPFDLSGSLLLRQIHTVSAYWGYLLVSIHIGMHWQMLYKHFFGRNINKLYTTFIRMSGLLVAILGMLAFNERDMYSKLFMGLSFDFWDKFDILFLVYHFLIMGLFVWITYYILKVISFLIKRNNVDF